jgi:hypothetical protein
MAATLKTCEKERAFEAQVCEYKQLCPGAVDKSYLKKVTCVDYLDVDIYLTGAYKEQLGSDPSGPSLEAWALYHLREMLPGLEYKENHISPAWMGNGVNLRVPIFCPDGKCPKSFLEPPPKCTRGNCTDTKTKKERACKPGERPSWKCVGGPKLPDKNILPKNTTRARIWHAYHQTEAHWKGWDRKVQQKCDKLNSNFMELGALNCQREVDGDAMNRGMFRRVWVRPPPPPGPPPPPSRWSRYVISNCMAAISACEPLGRF